MARIGYRNALYNKINASTNKYEAITSGGVPKLERVIDEKFAPEYNSAELYADDVLAEVDYSFKKGTLTITCADDTEQIEADFLGGSLTTTTNILTSNINDSGVEMGYGHIVTLQEAGVKKYKVEFFPRVKWQKITTDSKTRGESAEFGTTTLEGVVLPCDRAINGSAVGDWRKKQTFTTFADAQTYLTTCLTPAV